MIACKNCCFYDYPASACNRFPKEEKKNEDDWCGEYQKGPNRQAVSKMMDGKPRG